MKDWRVRVYGTPGDCISVEIHQFMAGGFLPDHIIDESGCTVFEFEADSSADVTIWKDHERTISRGAICESYAV